MSHHRPVPPLIPAAARRPALVAVVAGAAVAVALGAVVWRGTTTPFDSWFIRHVAVDFGGSRSWQRRWWLLFSEPVVSILVPLVVLIWAWRVRQRRLAVFAAVGPLLAVAVTELIGKPLVGRVIGPFVLQGSTAYGARGSYPSGHETGTVAWLIVVLVVVFGRTRRARVRAAAVTAAVVWALAAAFGLTINYYHYATDTIGAMGCTTAVLLAVALLTDRVAGCVADRRPGRPGGLRSSS